MNDEIKNRIIARLITWMGMPDHTEDPKGYLA